jgi:hypothetical protein
MTMARRDDRELRESIKAVSAAVIVGLIVLIVLAAIGSPFFGRTQDPTLLLGLTVALIGAFLPLVGLQLHRRDDEGDDDGDA